MKKIEVFDWLKNGLEWYKPIKKPDLSEYENVELLSVHHDFDIFYAWNNSDKKLGRLFRGKWNDGKI